MGSPDVLTDTVARVLVGQVRAKIEPVSSNPTIIRTEIGAGYRLLEGKIPVTQQSGVAPPSVRPPFRTTSSRRPIRPCAREPCQPMRSEA